MQTECTQWKLGPFTFKSTIHLLFFVIFCSADIQVGVPFTALVEKAMESKGKELLPKIQGVIKSLCQTKPTPTKSADTRLKPKGETAVVTSKPEVEFDLSLPIDLPGLSSSYPSSAAAKKSTGTTATDKSSSRGKHRQAESNTKEARTKAKTQTSNGKGDRLVARGKEEGKEEVEKALAVGEVAVKDRKVAKVKKTEKSAQEKPREEKEKGKEEKSVQEKHREGKSREEKPREEKEKEKSTHREDKSKEEKPREEKSKDGSVPIRAEKGSKGSATASIPSGSRDAKLQDDDCNGKKSEQPARRRSARIASLTEDPRKDDSDSENEETAGDRQKRRRSVDEQEARKKAKVDHRKKHRDITRKRARVWSSSSSEESSDGKAKLKRSKTGKAKDNRVSSKQRGGTRGGLAAQKQQAKDSHDPIAKRPRRISKSGSPSPAAEGKKRGNSIGRSSKSPLKSPPTVTRFNRQVKPNRRYYTSEDEEEEMEVEEEMEGDSAAECYVSGYSSGEDTEQ